MNLVHLWEVFVTLGGVPEEFFATSERTLSESRTPSEEGKTYVHTVYLWHTGLVFGGWINKRVTATKTFYLRSQIPTPRNKFLDGR